MPIKELGDREVPATHWHLKVLYDGQCPFCQLEVRWLGRWNSLGHLAFEDISDPAFDAGKYGLTHEQVMGTLHGVLSDGRLIRRVEVFRQAYRALGLGWLVVPTGWPVLRPLFDEAYRLFARHRVRLGAVIGRGCQNGTCSVGHPSTQSLEERSISGKWARARGDGHGSSPPNQKSPG
jgi:predicted DCC family thiol-disulfide oxidoreductase YuxK